ncbi:MAG: hypothetical protein DRP85_07900 [Candidatus Makaraimicrobium thalassicum]|nr:MAG: hypothetical protein DRP85_07900 [Candidatus Omnitrophota bacterium]
MHRAVMKKIFTAGLAVVFASGMLLLIPACTPSYPKEKLPEAVRSICKTEYDMDVDITVIGATMGIYYPMKGLLDAGLGINEEAWDKISNLLLIASRVVLSTDADIKFYCVITQDVRLPELQVVIIKYVEDVKRGMYRIISRGESFKRTLFSINLTPQAKKERSIEKVFEKLGVGQGTRETVMDEFFRSPPTKVSEVGYWRGKFYLKDVTLEEFLAAQVANRIKLDFRREKELTKLFTYKAAEGLFISAGGSRSILVKFKILDQSKESETGNLRVKKIQELVHIANEVVYGYKFRDFDFLMMEDELENARLMVSGEDVYDFERKKLSVEDIVQVPAGYF